MITIHFHCRECDETGRYPSFGGVTESNDNVLRFYSKWSNFTTHRSFAGADLFNPLKVCLYYSC